MKVQWANQIKKAFRFDSPVTQTILPGIYPFRREANGSVTRFHLRVESDGSGLLLANASVAARLTASGVLISKKMLEGSPVDSIRNAVMGAFRGVREVQLQKDIAKLQEFIETLSSPEDNYPIFNLEDPSLETPHRMFAPFHAQLRVAPPEMNNPLLGRLWEGGVMHVTFLGNKTNSADQAVTNVERAEDLGMISGVRGTATWFQSPDLIRRAAMAGVDYIVIPVLSSDPKIHDSIFAVGDFENVLACLEECRKWEVCFTVEIPVLKANVNEIESLLSEISNRGVRNVFSYVLASEVTGPEIIRAAVQMEELSCAAEVRYVWLPAVTGAREFVLQQGPRTSGDVSVRVEPDGSVYPARGPFVSGGNLRKESLRDIWNKDVFRRYRDRVESSTRCEICPGLQICAADCPADPKGWAAENEA